MWDIKYSGPFPRHPSRKYCNEIFSEIEMIMGTFQGHIIYKINRNWPFLFCVSQYLLSKFITEKIVSSFPRWCFVVHNSIDTIPSHFYIFKLYVSLLSLWDVGNMKMDVNLWKWNYLKSWISQILQLFRNENENSYPLRDNIYSWP